jgi:hypothetical protein
MDKDKLIDTLFEDVKNTSENSIREFEQMLSSYAIIPHTQNQMCINFLTIKICCENFIKDIEQDNELIKKVNELNEKILRKSISTIAVMKKEDDN